MDSTGPAPTPKPRAFLAGAQLVWTRQRILWWIFAVNLILSFVSVRGVAESAGAVLDHTLESSRRFVYGFDAFALAELSTLPAKPLRGMSGIVLWPSVFFTLFMVFITGGLLVSYYDDLRLDTAGFFEACGRHFWRYLRLLVYFAIVMIPIGIFASFAQKVYENIDDAAISPYSGPVFACLAAIVILFLLVCVRLWFDMAQVIAMAKDERRMHRVLRRAASLIWNNFASLFWLFLRISVIGCLVFGAGLYVWMMKLRPEATPLAFLLGQAMIVLWLGTRLWQRASETEWYKQYRSSQYAPVPMPPAPSNRPVTQIEVLTP
jgi:hypothetical protein